MANFHESFFQEKTLKKAMPKFHESFFQEKTLKKAMPKFHESFSSGRKKANANFHKVYLIGIVLFVFILATGFVCADGSWGDISGGGNSSSGVGNVSTLKNVTANNSSVKENLDNQTSYPTEMYNNSVQNIGNSQGSSVEYTINFYIAIGFVVILLIIVLYFLYFFIRKPKNKWK